jgi:hypothetical protein
MLYDLDIPLSQPACQFFPGDAQMVMKPAPAKDYRKFSLGVQKTRKPVYFPNMLGVPDILGTGISRDGESGPANNSYSP